MSKTKKRDNPDHDALYRTAEPQGGYFTSAQAAKIGFSRKLLWHLPENPQVSSVAHGIYRLGRFPSSRFEDLFVAWLKCGPPSRTKAPLLYTIEGAKGNAHTHEPSASSGHCETRRAAGYIGSAHPC